MDIRVASGDYLTYDTPLLVYGIWQDEPIPAEITTLFEAEDWSGEFKTSLLVYPRGALASRRLLLIGLGKRDQFTADNLCEIASLAAQKAHELKVTEYSFFASPDSSLSTDTYARAIAEGSILGLYRFLAHKTDLTALNQHIVRTLTLLAAQTDSQLEEGVQVGESIAQGVMLARDLVNGPGNDITPAKLGEVAHTLEQEFDLDVTVMGLDELRAQGFGGILAVGQGSIQPPRFIVMEHGATLTDVPTICLVGKGITFDTGGISIKPAERMDAMKSDMGGAAAVFGTMRAISTLKLPLHVVGLVSAAENMPSSTAYKPGDIITTLSGKTVEVLNTDAEGRIVLADALFYAQRYNPDAIIDLATLTGAIVVALGHHAMGMMSNSDDLVQRLTQAGDQTGERVWRMPLWDAYKKLMDSDVADVKNTGGRPGGALSAAGFLSHFVGDYPWTHLDIAGVAMTDHPIKAYHQKGATGSGVRLLVEALHTWITP
ncbi:MAG: leucyl aminopeptidase [Chloroflexota bacterium]